MLEPCGRCGVVSRHCRPAGTHMGAEGRASCWEREVFPFYFSPHSWCLLAFCLHFNSGLIINPNQSSVQNLQGITYAGETFT